MLKLTRNSVLCIFFGADVSAEFGALISGVVLHGATNYIVHIHEMSTNID